MGATSVTSPLAPSRHPVSWLTVLTVGAALDLLLFVWYLNATIIRTPFWDMYSWVLHYLDYQAGDSGWWAYLWASHDVHRPVWIRLLTAFDIHVFGGVSYPFIVVATALHAMTAWLLWSECRKNVAGSLGHALGYLVLMLVLTSVSAVDCAIPIANGYLHVLAVAVLAIVLFDGGEDGSGRAAGWRRAGATLAAVSAPFASAVGWAIWPILLWICWRGKAGRRWTLALAAIGAALAIVYFRGLTIPVGAGTAAGPAVDSAGQLFTRIDYLLTYLGLPWTRSPVLGLVGRLCGAVLLVVGSWVVWRGVRRTPSNRLERIALALVMFSLASAVMATAGRAGVTGHDDVLVPARYSVLMTPLHVGLLWMAVPVFQRLWSAERARRRLEVALVGGCALLLVQQIAAGQAAAARTAVMREAIERFEAGESDPEIATVVYDDLDQARRELEIMRQAGVYLHAR